MKKSMVYTSIILVLIMLGLTLIVEASSQTDAQPDSLKVLNYTWYFDMIGGFHVVGEVQNQGTSVLNPVVLGGTIYTPDGTPQMRSNPCTVIVNYMLPQQKAPFLMDFGMSDMSWMSQGIDHVDFTVIKANSNTSYQYPDLRITNSELSVDSTGVCWVSGKVQNTGNMTANNVRVVGTFYNSSNDVIAAGYSVVLTPALLNPSSSAPFKVGAFDVNKSETSPNREISSYTLMIQTEGPLLTGTPPAPASVTSTNSTSTPPSSSDIPSDDGSSNVTATDYYLRYIAIAVVIAIVISVVLVMRHRRSSNPSQDKERSRTAERRTRPVRRDRSKS